MRSFTVLQPRHPWSPRSAADEPPVCDDFEIIEPTETRPSWRAGRPPRRSWLSVDILDSLQKKSGRPRFRASAGLHADRRPGLRRGWSGRSIARPRLLSRDLFVSLQPNRLRRPQFFRGSFGHIAGRRSWSVFARSTRPGSRNTSAPDQVPREVSRALLSAEAHATCAPCPSCSILDRGAIVLSRAGQNAGRDPSCDRSAVQRSASSPACISDRDAHRQQGRAALAMGSEVIGL